ncbi:hypothetical protein PI126_g23123 [Phytophthora idaei]|nr:hypothetical protein PI126_g23123 [Phytophthora idaei]
MRYQYFLAGRRNKGWKTTLSTSLVNSISQAVAVLLYKNMHIPNEDEAAFADENKTKPAAENATMQQTQNLLAQQPQQMTRPPRSPRRNNYAAVAYDGYAPNISVVTGNAPSMATSGRRMGPDKYTQYGMNICGRCNLLGCSRQTCRYNNMTCNNLKQRGHVAFKCNVPRQPNYGGCNRNMQSSPNGYGQCPNGDNGLRQNGSGNQQRGCFFFVR